MRSVFLIYSQRNATMFYRAGLEWAVLGDGDSWFRTQAFLLRP